MKYPTIRIEGAIVASDILEKIEQAEITGQGPADFKIEGNYKVKDEIARAWADVKDYWRIFKRKREDLASNERQTGTSETRNQWMIPFLGILGYKAEFVRAEEVNAKSYAISHRDSSLDKFPIHIMGFKDELDKKRKDSGPRMSPHALVQEYLNLTEHLYAIVTNGLQIRLLRDSSRLIKLSYIEFDLERMMEEEHYADFAILYRLLHYTRMPLNQEAVAESMMEVYHQDSLESGSRIRDGLSEAVENSIKLFANGFLQHPANEALRNWFEEGDHEEKQKQFYQWQLRLIYRLLFLMVIEERDLIYPKGADKKLKSYYYDFYSINKLRGLSEKRHLADARYSDYWLSIRNTFRLFENEKYGKPLGIDPLSGLFEYHQIYLLNNCALNNKVVMQCLRNLSVFKNKNNQQLMRVNYASLNVEEFGSVYEGLLEYDAVVQNKMGKPVFDFVKGSQRSSSGSHYTPDELVQPLIKHSLDYIIADKLKTPQDFANREERSGKQTQQEHQLLTITVCDVACGSGHILLNAARRIATELAIVRTGEEQPSPTELRQATRDVIKHCIYGVDLNPLAVELTKVALWMEAHNPGEPLNFLDHHIKCGNAIVGLAHRDELENGIANEAFKTLPGDDKEIAKAFLNQNRFERKERTNRETQLHAQFENTTTANVQEAMVEYKVFTKLPETTPEEINTKQRAYNKFLEGKGHLFLKTMCDTQVAQFFIPKTEANKDRLLTDNEFRQIMQGYKGWTGMKTAKATAVALNKRFFHWFLEFPEVFSKGGLSRPEQGGGGFDCILGNPPFLGGKRISGRYGDDFLSFIKHNYQPSSGGLDLVTYFFRRIFSIIHKNGFQALISTKTVYQGDSRIGGLEYILQNGGHINFALRLITWPGEANVEVSIIAIGKNDSRTAKYLDNKRVPIITSRLDSETDSSSNPKPLLNNRYKAFIGSVVNGTGFILEKEDISIFEKQVIYPYLSGNDLNNSISQHAGRFIINFFNWKEEDCKKNYPIAYERVLRKVKPHRDKVKREAYKKYWWQYAEKCSELYERIDIYDKVIAIPRVSKYLNAAIVDKKQVFMDKVVVLSMHPKETFWQIQNSIFDFWAWKYSSTLGSSTINFRPTEAFQTFPFLEGSSNIEIGLNYYSHRSELMNNLCLGLTKTYNQFHNKKLSLNVELLDSKALEKKYSKETWNLYNHLDIKNVGNISYLEAVPLIFKLRELHKEMDEAVLAAYRWHEDSEKWGPAIDLAHNFYEVDYLPENDRIRYTISPEARKEVLKRLLLLNHERYAEEVAQGLHDKKKSRRPKKQNLRPKTLRNVAAEPESPYKQTSLFEEPNLFSKQENTIQERSKVIIKNQDGKEFKYHLLKIIQKGNFTGEFKDIATNSKLALAMMGKKEGEEFEFGGMEYVVVGVM